MAIVGTGAAGQRATRRGNTLLLAMLAFYSMLPIIYLLIASTKSPRKLYTTFGLAFADFHLWRNIHALFTYDNDAYMHWLGNSIFYSVTCSVGATLFCAMGAYAFAKFDFFGKRFMYSLTLGALMIPQTVLAIPIFLMLAKIGLVDTPWAVILPTMVYVPGIFLMRIYIDQSVPNELIEAARIDGAGEIATFFQIAFRLMAPGQTTVALLSFVQTWNSYFLPLIVLNSTDKLPLTVGLSNWYTIANDANGGEALFCIILTGALISVIPIVAAFLLMQRYWQSGLTVGAVK